MDLIKNQKGMALPLTLVIMLALSVLGTALWQYNMTDTLQVSRDHKRMQAYYIARSAADAMAEYIIKNPLEAAPLINKTSASNLAQGTLGDGTFGINVAGDPHGIVEIISTGNYGAVSSTVTLQLPRLNATAVFSKALSQTSSQHLDLWNMKVNGDVESAGTIAYNSNNFNGKAYPNSDSYYLSPIFPTLPPASPFNRDAGNNNITIPGNLEYGTISSGPQGNVTFATGGSNVKVVVDVLDVKGNILVGGGGRVELYIRTSAVLQTPKNYNDNPAQLIVYLADGASLAVIANGDFNGYIYGPGAKVYIQSNSSLVNGAVIANILGKNDVNGPNGIVNYVPPGGDVDIFSTVYAFRRGYWNK